MQTRKLAKPPVTLVQGHIFNLKNLRFADGTKSHTFGDFYPHVDIRSVRKGVVVTQTCDLAHRKSPYITIGLLEPFNKNPLELLGDGFIEKVFLARPTEGAAFYSADGYKKSLGQELGSFIQNHSQYYFFLSIPSGRDTSYFYVNLTKLFPIRCSNYDTVLKGVTHMVKNDFQHLIGWKMANLYGRVGVDDYQPAGIQKIIGSLAPKIEKQIKKVIRQPLKDVGSADTLGKLKRKFAELDAAPAGVKKDQLERSIADLLQATKVKSGTTP